MILHRESVAVRSVTAAKNVEAHGGGDTELLPTAFPKRLADSLLPTLILIDCHFDDLCKNPEGRSVATMRTAHVDRSYGRMSRNDPAEILVFGETGDFRLVHEEVREH